MLSFDQIAVFIVRPVTACIGGSEESKPHNALAFYLGVGSEHR